MIERCARCAGKKKINGIGGMQKTCGECKGVGHIKVIDDNLETKKRGRPKNGEKE
jgi:hypothetical protein